MAHSRTARAQLWAALCFVLLAPPRATGIMDQQAREDSFIGYSERTLPGCTDSDARCHEFATTGACYKNPWFMRESCKRTCMEPCSIDREVGAWAGHVQEGGTAAYAQAARLGFKATPGHFRVHQADKGTNLTLSSVGVGTYLGPEDLNTDELVTNAIIKSVAEGWNVIDTAANYRGGRAEVAVGRALRTLRLTSAVARSQIFVSTKAGYLSDDLTAPLLAARKIKKADIVLGHCMHPACLEASLSRSLVRLGVESVDLLYLHNPAESQLEQLGKKKFMARLADAIAYLEGARTSGRLRWYGLAVWDSFRSEPSHPEHLQLSEVVELARRAGGEGHGLRFVQVPLNAGMLEAATRAWQPVKLPGARHAQLATLLEAAQQLGVGVFSSGPLLQSGLLHDQELKRSVESAHELQGLPTAGTQLVQLARSAPGLLCTLVGQKSRANVEANLALTGVSPLAPADFDRVVARLGKDARA